MATESLPAAPVSEPWHALEHADVVGRLGTRSEAGLRAEEVAARTAAHGRNVLPEARRRSLRAVFLHQFASPLIYLLIVAAGIAVALRELSDAVVILIVVLLNAVIGTLQEQRAETALAALARLSVQRARVVRDGREQAIDAGDLVPGDLLLLAAGDAVTADARLLDSAALQISEASLTGESVPVAKRREPAALDAALPDRHSMVYAGTHVTAGRARAVVIGTGLATEIGRIATLTTAKSPPTPLERRIDQFGRYIMVGAVAMFALFVAIGLARGLPIGDIAMLGISQVVGMIPEGLPVAMTIALAVGVQRMARRRAIVRRLAAVETLGSTTVICTDKTGTLTRNEMTVTALVLPGRGELIVTGSGYAPHGELTEDGQPLSPAEDAQLIGLFEAAALCNDAHLAEPDASDSRWRPIGDPTEAALVTLAMKGGVAPVALRARLPRRAEIPFDAAIQLMVTEHETQTGPRLVIKGAPEAVFALCRSVRHPHGEQPFDEAQHAQLRATVRALADRALRVLAFAVVEGHALPPGAAPDQLRDRATLLGLVGQIDPPRAEAATAVAACQAAGIRPVMVTGDHKATGLAIARTLGLARPADLALDGRELDALTTEALAAKLDQVAVFARVQPAQKLRIIEAYQRRDDVVAMTGDGVNDAPALIRADVGVAMGITGTDVAKEAAKIVVTDDNFGTIVAAVEEGRVVYRNIKRAVLFLFATSLAEVLVLLLAVALGYPAPFAAVQILWNNLVTEGVITINLVMHPADGDEMRRPPVPPNERLITRAMLGRLAVMTPAIVLSTLGWFTYRLASGVPYEVARSETFTLLAVCEWFNVLNCLSDRRSAFSFQLFRNPWLVAGLVVGNLLQVAVIYLAPMQRVFHTVPFGIEQVLAIGLVASLVLWAEEARKLVVRLRARRARRRTDG